MSFTETRVELPGNVWLSYRPPEQTSSDLQRWQTDEMYEQFLSEFPSWSEDTITEQRLEELDEKFIFSGRRILRPRNGKCAPGHALLAIQEIDGGWTAYDSAARRNKIPPDERAEQHGGVILHLLSMIEAFEDLGVPNDFQWEYIESGCGGNNKLYLYGPYFTSRIYPTISDRGAMITSRFDPKPLPGMILEPIQP